VAKAPPEVGQRLPVHPPVTNPPREVGILSEVGSWPPYHLFKAQACHFAYLRLAPQRKHAILPLGIPCNYVIWEVSPYHLSRAEYAILAPRSWPTAIFAGANFPWGYTAVKKGRQAKLNRPRDHVGEIWQGGGQRLKKGATKTRERERALGGGLCAPKGLYKGALIYLFPKPRYSQVSFSRERFQNKPSRYQNRYLDRLDQFWGKISQTELGYYFQLSVSVWFFPPPCCLSFSPHSLSIPRPGRFF